MSDNMDYPLPVPTPNLGILVSWMRYEVCNVALVLVPMPAYVLYHVVRLVAISLVLDYPPCTSHSNIMTWLIVRQWKTPTNHRVSHLCYLVIKIVFASSSPPPPSSCGVHAYPHHTIRSTSRPDHTPWAGKARQIQNLPLSVRCRHHTYTAVCVYISPRHLDVVNFFFFWKLDVVNLTTHGSRIHYFCRRRRRYILGLSALVSIYFLAWRYICTTSETSVTYVRPLSISCRQAT
jgi:hypothetical protein